MSTVTIGVIGLIALFVLLAIGMPVGMTMFLIGFFGYAYLLHMKGAMGILQTTFYTTGSNYNFTVIPLFTLMGQFIFHAGVSGRLYETGHKWLGQLPGGLAVATVGACGAFAAICGSSTATAATFTTVSLPEMRKYNYSPDLATGCIVAGGTLGILIPPSSGFIVYGIITEQSIGKLFAAGFVPGIVLMLCYMSAVIIQAKRKPELAPPSPRYTIAEKLRSTVGALPVLILFIIVIGGIFFGWFTANEGAAVGAFGGLICMILNRKMNWKTVVDSLKDAMSTTAMIMFIMIGAMVFGNFLALSRIPSNLATFVAGLDVNRYIVLACILFMYAVLGCLMDSMAMILLTVPIFFPVIKMLGFDTIWYGVLMVMVMEMGLITPPVGMNLFVVKGIAGDVSMMSIIRGVIPHVAAIIIALVIMVAFPQLSLFLPGILY
ncbi:MAG: TRAP transporter large permease [Oscillospiraceae bacterium]|nr:TRAP transporter large permease [Oscillospiraceae bacterium]